MSEVAELLEQHYRESVPALVAVLTRMLGPGRLDTVEALVHDTFLAALDGWTAATIPANPGGWLMTVARNRALDLIRRTRPLERAVDLDSLPSRDAREAPALRGELADDLLRMLFVSCHPALTLESQIALSLRTLCGFETSQIARALLSDEAAMEKRLVRARQTLREAAVTFELPDERHELSARRGAVLRVLYLLFSEGYSARRGERQIHEDLCHEAIRLVGMLLDRAGVTTAEVHALAALMMLQASRLPARLAADGNLLTLAEQDRGRWDRALIRSGLEHLAASARGAILGEYHLEAGIAACHAMAANIEATDWRRIVGYYDSLLALNDSPVIRLNRAIALAYADGPAPALRELALLARDPRLDRYGLLEAAEADLRARTGDTRRARAAYERALELVATEPERQLLRRRMAELA
jgi:RNA polymerase sigma factor (sigma-70 family)